MAVAAAKQINFVFINVTLKTRQLNFHKERGLS